MGYPVSKTTALQPDGKMSTMHCNACIQTPTTLGNLITCNRKLLFGPNEGIDGGISEPCGRSALCVNHGSHNSIGPLMKHIRTLNGERHLKQKLKCKDYGIYAACCKNCNNYYAGKTMTSFS